MQAIQLRESKRSIDIIHLCLAERKEEESWVENPNPGPCGENEVPKPRIFSQMAKMNIPRSK